MGTERAATFVGDVEVQRPKRWLAVGAYPVHALGLGVLAAMLISAFSKAFEPLAVVMVMNTAWLVLLYAGLVAYRRTLRWERARLIVDADGVHLDGVLILRRGRLKGGCQKPATSGSVEVTLFGRRSDWFVVARYGHFTARLSDATAAEDLLGALDVAPKQRSLTAHFNRLPDGLSLPALLLIGVAAFVFALRVASLPLAVLFEAAAMGALLGFNWTAVTVGLDGVRIRRLGITRFIPFREIDRFTAGKERLEFALSSGRTIRAYSGLRWLTGDLALRPRDAVVHRLHAVLASRWASTSIAALVVAAERGDTRVPAWIDAMRSLPSAARYREAAISTDSLRDVVEDASLAGNVRVGAALALRVAGGAEAGAWTKRIAQASASTELREALEAIGDDASDELLVRRIDAVLK